MKIELLQKLSIGAYVVAGLFLIAAIVLFFVLDIRKVYGDLSGNTAKKAIENIRKQNESSGDKAYKPSAENIKRGKITDKITDSGKIQSEKKNNYGSVGTAELNRKSGSSGNNSDSQPAAATNQNVTETYQQPASDTTVLTEQPPQDTTVLAPDTTVLSCVQNGVQESAGTTVLDFSANANADFVVEYEISFAESTEIIE